MQETINKLEQDVISAADWLVGRHEIMDSDTSHAISERAIVQCEMIVRMRECVK